MAAHELARQGRTVQGLYQPGSGAPVLISAGQHANETSGVVGRRNHEEAVGELLDALDARLKGSPPKVSPPAPPPKPPIDRKNVLNSLDYTRALKPKEYDKRLDKAQARDGNGYAVFGKVVSGMDVVDKARAVATGNRGPFQNVPQTPITILKATLEK